MHGVFLKHTSSQPWVPVHGCILFSSPTSKFLSSLLAPPTWAENKATSPQTFSAVASFSGHFLAPPTLPGNEATAAFKDKWCMYKAQSEQCLPWRLHSLHLHQLLNCCPRDPDLTWHCTFQCGCGTVCQFCTRLLLYSGKIWRALNLAKWQKKGCILILVKFKLYLWRNHFYAVT